MKTAIITITPDNPDKQMNIETGGVSKLVICDLLDVAMKSLARQIVEEARKHVGDDPEAQARWIDLQRQNPDQN